MRGQKVLFAIVLLGVLLRLINIGMPILEGTATRQVQTAMVARNFYRSGFNVLYPQVDSMGPEPGYLVLEFPLLNLLAASGYKLLGGVHEWTGRLISIFFFVGALLCLFGIARRLFGERVALWSAAVFTISPLSIIFSRTFMPDFEALFFCAGAIYFMLRYSEAEKSPHFWTSAVLCSFALLTKPHSFYIAIPLLFLLWKKYRFKVPLVFKNWAYLAIAVIPALLWYMHGKGVHQNFSQIEAYNFELFHWFNPRLLLDKELYKDLFEIYSGVLLTPIGLALFIGGIFIRTKNKENLIWAWLAGVGIYMLLFNTHIDEAYYNIFMLPVASIFVGRTIVFLQTTDWVRSSYLNNKFGKVALGVIILLFIARFALYAYVVPAGYRYLPEAGDRVQELTTKDSLVIASAAGGPAALYYCDRKGWSFHLPGPDKEKTEEAIERIESLREQGAQYFMSAVMDEFNRSESFKEYMLKNYKLIEIKGDRYIIFSLTS